MSRQTYQPSTSSVTKTFLQIIQMCVSKRQTHLHLALFPNFLYSLSLAVTQCTADRSCYATQLHFTHDKRAYTRDLFCDNDLLTAHYPDSNVTIGQSDLSILPNDVTIVQTGHLCTL